MKPEIENLKTWIYGKSITDYQKVLGIKEFEQLLSYVNHKLWNRNSKEEI